MKYEFILRIDTERTNFNEVSRIIELIPTDTSIYWDYAIRNKGFSESLNEIAQTIKCKF